MPHRHEIFLGISYDFTKHICLQTSVWVCICMHADLAGLASLAGTMVQSNWRSAGLVGGAVGDDKEGKLAGGAITVLSEACRKPAGQLPNFSTQVRQQVPKYLEAAGTQRA